MLKRATDQMGNPLPDRTAAPRLRGEGRYTGDVAPADALHLAFVRAPVPEGNLRPICTEDAAALPGVHAIHTGADVADLGRLSINEVIPLARVPDYPVLASETVTCLGQPVAAVLADGPQTALDALELRSRRTILLKN